MVVEVGKGMKSSLERLPGSDVVVGVLMLDTRFPRYPGDIGNPASITCRSLHRRVPLATVARIVATGPLSPELVARFVAAGHALIADGATLIVTSCGFLHAEQRTLASALSVPVVTSALVLLPLVRAIHGTRGPIGVLTFDEQALGHRHLGEARSASLVVEGLQSSSHFHAVISEDREVADRDRMEQDAVAAATRLARHRPAAVILECTNLAPYKGAIKVALDQVPVFDLHDAIACCTGALDEPSAREPGR